MTDKGWHLSDFGSDFLHFNVTDGAIPLNPLPKHSYYVVFFVLYEFRVVYMLYKRVVCVLYFLCYISVLYVIFLACVVFLM